MMGSCNEEEDDRFFDTREELSDLGSDCSEDCSSSRGLFDCASNKFHYEFWIKRPDSVNERRVRFLRWMGLSMDQNPIMRENSGDVSCDSFEIQNFRIIQDSGAVLRAWGSENGCSSSESFVSNKDPELVEENFIHKIENLDSQSQLFVDELSHEGAFSRLREVGLNRLIIDEEFQKARGSSPLGQRLSRREEEASNLLVMKKKVNLGWLRRLGAVACIANGHGQARFSSNNLDPIEGMRTQRLQIYPHRKKSKELSSLFMGQEFPAHEGSISAMKFSLDGKYLASAGEDGIVRIWKVIEEERSNKFDISDMDPSCLYFQANDLSELSPLDVDKEKLSKMKRSTKSSDLTFVIFPQKVFHLLEKPLHEFHGHSGEVLDLSWSRKGYLLSSSVDKTVRLWQVGCNRCLRVFSHNNYVTCIDFNPMDDNYFISGSIDGKVRIWEVLGCRVVDWTDIREIITAVCYRPDGKGGIVGSMTGSCHFYDITDNQLQMDTQICLQGKKKLPWKRITGFQFCPDNPAKVMVTSADSRVRMLCGVDVIRKFRGLRNAGSHLSFTADGKHIVSTSDDSNVYIWNYINSQDKGPSRVKNLKCYESFLSHNASIAIPWSGTKNIPDTLSSPTVTGDMLRNSFENENSHPRKPSLPTPTSFSLSPGLLLEPSPKGSATWPEEKLSNSSPVGVSPSMCKSEYKSLKSACHSMSSSPHMWGLVIVTAGWDGWIRTYHNYGLPVHR
ncbi:uncharacterized WD repeat-containing protein C3H5.08c isoform X2 [Malania oleifera]|uniref:uncharacterized WD repeat-containing protein C3H5.08c isoform X2 n=1 Tax=Malania oleifera TaxID=397392 RepID=UPI0025AEA9B5|nr:uncharacterized WD repeat-containing protein C3H5.08c isoform X2 [Malania oleifera]